MKRKADTNVDRLHPCYKRPDLRSKTFKWINCHLPDELSCIVYEYLTGNENLNCCRAAKLGVAEFVKVHYGCFYHIGRNGYTELLMDMLSKLNFSPKHKKFTYLSYHYAAIGAAEGSHWSIVHQLLSHLTGPSIWTSILYYGIKHNCIDIVKLAINHGANCFDQLFRAALYNRIDIAKFLISKGEKDCSAIWVAAEKGNLEMVKLLCKSMTCKHPICRAKERGLKEALQNHHWQVAKYLIEQGVGANQYTKYYDQARRQNDQKVLFFLENLGDKSLIQR